MLPPFSECMSVQTFLGATCLSPPSFQTGCRFLIRPAQAEIDAVRHELHRRLSATELASLRQHVAGSVTLPAYHAASHEGPDAASDGPHNSTASGQPPSAVAPARTADAPHARRTRLESGGMQAAMADSAAPPMDVATLANDAHTSQPGATPASPQLSSDPRPAAASAQSEPEQRRSRTSAARIAAPEQRLRDSQDCNIRPPAERQSPSCNASAPEVSVTAAPAGSELCCQHGDAQHAARVDASPAQTTLRCPDQGVRASGLDVQPSHLDIQQDFALPEDWGAMMERAELATHCAAEDEAAGEAARRAAEGAAADAMLCAAQGEGDDAMHCAGEGGDTDEDEYIEEDPYASVSEDEPVRVEPSPAQQLQPPAREATARDAPDAATRDAPDAATTVPPAARVAAPELAVPSSKSFEAGHSRRPQTLPDLLVWCRGGVDAQAAACTTPPWAARAVSGVEMVQRQDAAAMAAEAAAARNAPAARGKGGCGGRSGRGQKGAGGRGKKQRTGRAARELEETEAAEVEGALEVGFYAHIKRYEVEQRRSGAFGRGRKARQSGTYSLQHGLTTEPAT